MMKPMSASADTVEEFTSSTSYVKQTNVTKTREVYTHGGGATNTEVIKPGGGAGETEENEWGRKPRSEGCVKEGRIMLGFGGREHVSCVS